MKNQKGITLVALIITIIVMLILVAVTVTTIINSNLLGTAKQAGKDFQQAANNEANGEYKANIAGTGEVDISNYNEAMNTIRGYIND